MRIANKMAAGTALIAMLISIMAPTIAFCLCPSGALRPAHACHACDESGSPGPQLARGSCCMYTSVAVPPVVAASSVTLAKPAPVALFVATLSALTIDAPTGVSLARSGADPPDRVPTDLLDSSILRL